MNLHKPQVVTDGGPWAAHDQACAVCATRHAVIDVGTGIFGPCWGCQEKGWHLVRRRTFRQWRRDLTPGRENTP